MPKCNPETRQSSSIRRLLCVLLSISLMLSAGCGLKGDLTLESDTPAAETDENTEELEQESA